uniref:Uncharacterized protein n=1 Tax=Siphoviridae sp. ctL0q1 TaxID=2825449 RepID=A0A8S5PJ81_9CAUD|nr:MAG TPA: hypothetical protein [Siphoviridae sp. ctL0q1]
MYIKIAYDIILLQSIVRRRSNYGRFLQKT